MVVVNSQITRAASATACNKIMGKRSTMKRFWLYFLAIQAVLLSAAAHAELKIGYVNAQRLLEESPQATTATERLKKEFAPREDGVRTMQKDVASLEDDLRRNADTMAEEDRRKKEKDLRDRQRELRRVQEEFRDELNFRRNEELGKLQALVKQIIEKVSRDEQYDLVLFDGIAFASPRIDLTEKILERLRTEKDLPKPAAAPGPRVGGAK